LAFDLAPCRGEYCDTNKQNHNKKDADLEIAQLSLKPLLVVLPKERNNPGDPGHVKDPVVIYCNH
jgi:hypothetical protein